MISISAISTLIKIAIQDLLGFLFNFILQMGGGMNENEDEETFCQEDSSFKML